MPLFAVGTSCLAFSLRVLEEAEWVISRDCLKQMLSFKFLGFILLFDFKAEMLKPLTVNRQSSFEYSIPSESNYDKTRFSFSVGKESIWKTVEAAFIDFLNVDYLSKRKQQSLIKNIKKIIFHEIHSISMKISNELCLSGEYRRMKVFFFLDKNIFFSGKKNRFHRNGNKTRKRFLQTKE